MRANIRSILTSLFAAGALPACGGSPAQVDAPPAASQLPEAPNPCAANPCGATSIDPNANPCATPAAPEQAPANPCAGDPASEDAPPAAEDAPPAGSNG